MLAAFAELVEFEPFSEPSMAAFRLTASRARPIAYDGLSSTLRDCHWNRDPVRLFANGLRIIDIKNPHSPREVARFLPDVPQGCDRVSSNDVTVDERGLIYLLDRQRGLTIIGRT